MNRFFLLFSACFLLGSAVSAQRLPATVTPETYTLTFTPDLAKETFAGSETIHVRLLKPASHVVLNAVDIDFQKVTIASGNSAQEARVTLDTDKEQASFAVEKPLEAGAATIQIEFTGILNHDLRGFYVGKQDNGQKYAATQLEATDARRAFPCFDEPAYKATFQVTIVADKELSVISNTKALSDLPGPADDKHTVRFERTPKMSSYLVAFVIGNFEYIEGSSDGIPIRVYTSPGKKDMSVFALDTAEHVLHYYNQYFGIRYPFGKLDMVALSDFGPGAMENTACITYREGYILLDEKHAGVERKKFIASVIAHEMAHQWFGDLVTMKWWDDIWLNEGFASWMSSKPVEAWKPEWHVELNDVNDAVRAMDRDSLENTHPIHQQAETPAEILELADEITYDKTSAVLRMLESYLGAATFRAGVNAYLRQHAYGNAAAADFWNAMASASKKPVDKIMATFVEQPGFPFVAVKADCLTGKENLDLSQTRYVFDRAKFGVSSNELWQIPLCIKDRSSSAAPGCELLTQRQQNATLAGCSSWVETNAGGSGFYHSSYDARTVSALAKNAESALSPAERIMLLADVWASVRVDREKIGDFLVVAEGLASDRTPQVSERLVRQLGLISRYLVSDEDKPAYQAWVRDLFQPLAQQVGWEPKPGEDERQQTLRSNLLEAMAGIGHDPAAVAAAKNIAEKALQNPESVNPELAGAALPIAAETGDEAFYDKILAAHDATKDPEQKMLFMQTLVSFHDAKLLKRTLQYAVADARSQDSVFIIGRVIRSPAGEKIGWDFVRDEWHNMSKEDGAFGGGAGEIVASTSSFCDPGMRDQVQSFFSTHSAPAAQRTLKQSLEEIDYCIDMKSRQGPELATWLQNANGQAGK